MLTGSTSKELTQSMSSDAGQRSDAKSAVSSALDGLRRRAVPGAPQVASTSIGPQATAGISEEDNLAMSIYAYAATAADELTFAKGQTLVITERTSADWYKGYVRDASTAHLVPSAKLEQAKLFPANYVEVLPPRIQRFGADSASATANPQAEDKLKKMASTPAGQAAMSGAAFGEACPLPFPKRHLTPSSLVSQVRPLASPLGYSDRIHVGLCHLASFDYIHVHFWTAFSITPVLSLLLFYLSPCFRLRRSGCCRSDSTVQYRSAQPWVPK